MILSCTGHDVCGLEGVSQVERCINVQGPFCFLCSLPRFRSFKQDYALQSRLPSHCSDASALWWVGMATLTSYSMLHV